MVVRIRLARHGVRNRPFYHIVVANSASPRDGKFIEQVGTYDPFPNEKGEKHISMNMDKIKYWLTVGAQPSEPVTKLLVKADILPAPPRPWEKLPSKLLSTPPTLKSSSSESSA